VTSSTGSRPEEIALPDRGGEDGVEVVYVRRGLDRLGAADRSDQIERVDQCVDDQFAVVDVPRSAIESRAR